MGAILKICQNSNCSVEIKGNHTKKWCEKCKPKNQIARLYGFTIEEYEQFFVDHMFSCNICGIHQSQIGKTLYIDHCHTTGKVRGLLCQPCNSMLGNAKDNVDLLAKGIEYLNDRK